MIQSLDTEMFDAAEAPKPDQPATDGEETTSSAFGKSLNDGELMVVTKTEPTEAQIKDMELAMKVVKHTKSNGIVFVKDQMTIAIGPGQTNRIWAVENGIKRCQFDMEGAVMASDAFFPFKANAAICFCISKTGHWQFPSYCLQVPNLCLSSHRCFPRLF